MKIFQKKTNTPTTDNVSVAPTQLKSNPFLSGKESTTNPFLSNPVQMSPEEEIPIGPMTYEEWMAKNPAPVSSSSAPTPKRKNAA